jgi:general secretion pathway protein E
MANDAQTELLSPEPADRTVIVAHPPAFLCGRPIGEILVETVKLAPARIEEALALQRGEQAGSRLGEILVRLKAVSEEDVLRALAVQLDLPYLPRIDPADIPADLPGRVPIHFAKTARVLPLGLAGDAVRVAVADPLDTAAQDQLALLLGAPVAPEVALGQVVVDAINEVYDRAADEHDKLMEDLETEDLESVAHELEEPTDLLDAGDDEAPIIRLVNSLLFRAVKERASDIHINPEEKDISVRYRIDGVLREVIRPPKRFQASIASRIKIMGGLNIAEKRLPQDGRIRIKIAGKDVDIRLSTVPTAHGERIVMRLLDKSNVVLDLAELGFETWHLKVMDMLITRSHGIVLVTGPTGSGKTTTLYAALDRLNDGERSIATIEDPVEYQLPGVMQTEVHARINLTFARGLRTILRADPDVILVGEIRDEETAQIAIQAAMTGHLVLTTLHTNDAAGAIARLRTLRVDPDLLAGSINCIVSQRLARRLCSHCREEYEPTQEQVTSMNLISAGSTPTLHRAKGCLQCGGSGYGGRVALYELMPVHGLGRVLLDGSTDEIFEAAVAAGMRTLREDGVRLSLAGVTTLEEVRRITGDRRLV